MGTGVVATTKVEGTTGFPFFDAFWSTSESVAGNLLAVLGALAGLPLEEEILRQELRLEDAELWVDMELLLPDKEVLPESEELELRCLALPGRLASTSLVASKARKRGRKKIFMVKLLASWNVPVPPRYHNMPPYI